MSNIDTKTPVIGFSAYSGTGKTTLLKKLIPLLRQKNISLAVIKHAHHDFDIDYPGKDSYELRKAGATQMLVASAKRKALVTEIEDPKDEPCLAELIEDLNHDTLDLILVEGFKHENFIKIELHRQATGKPLLFESDSDIIALATDYSLETTLPLLDINDPKTITDFIVNKYFAELK